MAEKRVMGVAATTERNIIMKVFLIALPRVSFPSSIREGSLMKMALIPSTNIVPIREVA